MPQVPGGNADRGPERTRGSGASSLKYQDGSPATRALPRALRRETVPQYADPVGHLEPSMKRQAFLRPASWFGLVLAGSCGLASAAEWRDFSVGYRVGERFREPFNSRDIHKDIVSFTYASGARYGGHFFNLDLLKSDRNEPAATGSNDGALEAYVAYRYTLDLGKVSGRDLQWGAVRGVGLTAGFDWNHKDDIAYNSRKHMLVLGPTFMWDVPGFLNTSLLMTHESNAPSGPFAPISQVGSRYSYDPHPMLAVNWGIPVGSRVTFEGYANFIAAKGRDEVGNRTGAETNIDVRVMADVGALLGMRRNAFRAGAQYQFWNNKFGNTEVATGGQGYRASTPMLRAEFHF